MNMNITEALMEHTKAEFEKHNVQHLVGKAKAMFLDMANGDAECTATVEELFSGDILLQGARKFFEEFAAPYQAKLDIIAELQKLREWHLEIREAVKVCLEHPTSNSQQRQAAWVSLVELVNASEYEIFNCVMRSVD